MHHTRLLVVLAVLGAVTLSACRREAPPPPAPPPAQEDPGPDLDSLRAYEDSVRRAREEAERERARLAAVADARAILEQRIHFEFDESRITSDAERVLRQKAEILRASPDVRIRIEGHCDERGSVEYNLALGNRRAQSVVDFLTQQGISANRFETVSYGEERPMVNRSDEDAWAQNRRAEFVIVAGGDNIRPVAN